MCWRCAASTQRSRSSRAAMPDEFLPIIDAINHLIDRHQLAVEQQKRFVSEAAHELRTPLAALQIQVDNLRDQPNAAAERDPRELERRHPPCQRDGGAIAQAGAVG